MKSSIYIATFPFQNSECPDVTDYLVKLVHKLHQDQGIGDIFHKAYDDTPITMTRNKSVKDAQAAGADLLLMIDSDMDPDRGIRKPHYGYANVKPFMDVALPFLLQHSGPAVIAAPYCGPPPNENIYIFRPATYQSDHPNQDCRIEQFTREEAAQRAGIEEVYALPTGLMLIDMRVFKDFPKPVFKYEYNDDEEAEKGTTEDVFFSRNLALAGIKQYVAWDCWAGHWKRKCVFRPMPLTMDCVRKEYQEAVARGQKSDEKLMFVGEGQDTSPPAVRGKKLVMTGQHSSKPTVAGTADAKNDTLATRLAEHQREMLRQGYKQNSLGQWYITGTTHTKPEAEFAGIMPRGTSAPAINPQSAEAQRIVAAIEAKSNAAAESFENFHWKKQPPPPAVLTAWLEGWKPKPSLFKRIVRSVFKGI